MITKAQAIELRHGQELHVEELCFTRVGPRGGKTTNRVVWRVSGRPQTWKTRPDEFRVPIKWGLRESNALTHATASLFHLPEECPLARRYSGPCDWALLGHNEGCAREYHVDTLGAYNFCDRHQAIVDGEPATVAALFTAVLGATLAPRPTR